MDFGGSPEGGGRFRRRKLTDHDATSSGGIWSSRYLAITVANLTVVAIAAFDGLAVVAALPSIAEDLGRINLLPWVITAYLATSSVAVVVAGPVIDAIGVRRTFRITGTWFCIATGLAAIAPSMPLLIAARLVQGLGGGLVIAVALASVGLAYPHSLRPSAFAANSMVWGVLGFGGPALAGLLLAIADWRMVFGIQIPITIVALAMGWRSLPTIDGKVARPDSDPVGVVWIAVLVAASLVAVGEAGSSWLLLAVSLVAALVAGAGYWRHAGRHRSPVVRREHLRRAPLGAIHASTGVVLIAGLASDNYLPIYIQVVRGGSVGFAAFTLVFLTVGWTVGALVFARLPQHWPESRTTLIGSVAMVPSLSVVLVTFMFDGPLWALFVGYFAVGVSIGLVSTSGITWMQRETPDTEMGRVNAAHQFVRNLCITYAVAIGGAFLIGVVDHRTGDVESVRRILAGEDTVVSGATIDAVAEALVLTVSCALLVSLVAVVIIRRSHRRATSSSNMTLQVGN